MIAASPRFLARTIIRLIGVGIRVLSAGERRVEVLSGVERRRYCYRIAFFT
jgi:hypothetical protein